MAQRLISFSELDEIEGLVEHHRKLLERIELIENDAAQFDVPAHGVTEFSEKANAVKRELTERLERILKRLQD